MDSDPKKESHYQDRADLEAENAKLRAELAEARKSLDALRAAPSAEEIEAWRGSMAAAVGNLVECYAKFRINNSVANKETVDDAWRHVHKSYDAAVALMRRATAAPAQSALVAEARNILAILEYAVKGEINDRVFYEHRAAINRFKAALAAAPEAKEPSGDGKCWTCHGSGIIEHSAQQIPGGPTVFGYARNTCSRCGGTGKLHYITMEQLRGEPEPTPQPAAARDDTRRSERAEADGELQRLLDGYRVWHQNDCTNDFKAGAAFFLIEAMAQRLGAK